MRICLVKIRVKSVIDGQILKHRDIFMVVVIVVPAGAKVSRLPSLKEPLENKFSRGSNSHQLLITITPTIESLCFFICPRSFCAIYTEHC